MEFLDQLLFGPKLDIVNEEDHMNSSLASLDHFKKSGVGGRRGVDGIGGKPEILLTLINHFPDSLEKLIPIDNAIFIRKLSNRFQLPLTITQIPCDSS